MGSRSATIRLGQAASPPLPYHERRSNGPGPIHCPQVQGGIAWRAIPSQAEMATVFPGQTAPVRMLSCHNKPHEAPTSGGREKMSYMQQPALTNTTIVAALSYGRHSKNSVAAPAFGLNFGTTWFRDPAFCLFFILFFIWMPLAASCAS